MPRFLADSERQSYGGEGPVQPAAMVIAGRQAGATLQLWEGGLPCASSPT
jgi:hypothetical protein